MSLNLKDYAEEISTVMYKGDVLLKLCINLVLYSKNLNLPDQKEAVLRMFDEYTALYDKQLLWGANPQTKYFKKLKNGVQSYIHPKEWLLEHDQDTSFDIIYHGGAKSSHASDIVFEATSEENYSLKRNDMSMVVCRFPVEDFLTGRLNLPELMRRWCSYLKPHHGHAGLHMGQSYEYCYENISYHMETAFYLRFPGLSYYSFLDGLADSDKKYGPYYGPRGADWLVALADDPFLRQLGGLEKVRKAMEPLPVLPYDGGAVLQAGPAPGLGSTSLNLTLPDYEHMARVIEPVRVERMHQNELHIYKPRPSTPDYPIDEEIKEESERLSALWRKRFSPR